MNGGSKKGELLNQATRIDSDNPDCHFLLGVLYISANDKTSALEEHKILKTLDKTKANELLKLSKK